MIRHLLPATASEVAALAECTIKQAHARLCNLTRRGIATRKGKLFVLAGNGLTYDGRVPRKNLLVRNSYMWDASYRGRLQHYERLKAECAERKYRAWAVYEVVE